MSEEKTFVPTQTTLFDEHLCVRYHSSTIFARNRHNHNTIKADDAPTEYPGAAAAAESPQDAFRRGACRGTGVAWGLVGGIRWGADTNRSGHLMIIINIITTVGIKNSATRNNINDNNDTSYITTSINTNTNTRITHTY